MTPLPQSLKHITPCPAHNTTPKHRINSGSNTCHSQSLIQPTTTCNQHHNRRNHRNHQQHRHRRQRQHSLVSSIHVCVLRDEQLQSRCMTSSSCLVNRSPAIPAEPRMRSRPSLNQSHTHTRPTTSHQAAQASSSSTALTRLEHSRLHSFR